MVGCLPAAAVSRFLTLLMAALVLGFYLDAFVLGAPMAQAVLFALLGCVVLLGFRHHADHGAVQRLRASTLLQAALAALVPVEGRPAAMEDVARIRFSGTFADSGEAIEGGSSEGMEVELEEGRMIPGFVEGIIGMKPGDSRTVSCTFPESYPNQEAAGRKAEFAITLIELKTRELPPLDDAFAQ